MKQGTKSLALIGMCVGVMIATPAGAQRAGQSVSIQYGKVTAEQADLAARDPCSNAAPGLTV